MRHNWKIEEVQRLYDQPLLQLISLAHTTHVTYHSPSEIQVCSLISVKTGGCSEDCGYCSQSSKNQSGVKATQLMSFKTALEEAQKARERGATRICLGAAWRQVRDSKQFDNILEIVEGVSSLGVEVCCTLGMLDRDQAEKLKDAGLTAYNHNIDTSEEYYSKVVTTRTYQDRLKTLDIVQESGLSVCSGGIIGMGETIEDRLKFLLTLATRNPHPESVPINRLVPVKGTPLQDQPRVPFWELVKLIAVARVMMPSSIIRLSAGREELSYEEQALSFLAGANSIFMGEKLLTVANSPIDRDEEMFRLLGLKKLKPFRKEKVL